MNDSNLKRGDVVGYVFAQPGNDTTYLLLTEVRDDDASAWDLFFDMEIKALPLGRLWVASAREMESRTSFMGGKRSGSFSVQQLADEARKNLGLGA